MYNSKLYNILENFDKYEQNRCRKYIQSPYFNRSPQLMELYEQLVKEVNATQKTGLSKEQLWNTLQPDKPYDDVRFRKYCSDLLKLVEGYLAQEELEESPVEKSILLMRSIGKKNIKPLAPYIIKQSKKASKRSKVRSSEHFEHKYQIEKLTYKLSEADIKRGERSNVENISHNLDYFYVSEKLKYYCLVLMQKSFIKEEYEIKLIDEITDSIKKYQLDAVPNIAIYHHIYLLIKEKNNEKRFYELIKLLKKNNMLFHKEEAYNMYSYAINFCISRINQGDTKYVKECFDLFNELIETKIILLDGKLRAWDFKNIVVLALRLDYHQWTENFINKFSNRLPEAFRENAVTFNLARVYFYQKKHEKVVELLRDVEYDDVAYALGARALLLVTYYETDEIEPLYSLMESFRAFLNRHKDIPEKRRKNYKNLIKFTKKLTKIRYGDQDAIKKLRKEIEASEGVADAKWLNEQIAELEGTPKPA